MGNNNAPSIPDTDKDENPRISGDNVDLGAYEWQNPIIQNKPPSIPELVYPANGQTGLPTTLIFEWEQSTDPDGDTLSYKFNYCEDQSFTGCDPIVIASLKNNDTNYAGVGYGGGLFLLGIVTIGSIKGRRKILVLIFFVTGTLLVSCGGGGGGNSGSPPPPPPTNNITYTVSGLNPNTTYYWKVIADDGQDTSESAMRGFTTGN